MTLDTGEVISIVSGKGGSGKTLFASCLAYSLSKAGHSVCLVDTDFGTQGLSYYILGGGAEKGTSELSEKHGLYSALLGKVGSQLPVPKIADRMLDHGLVYPIIISNTRFYDRRLSFGKKEAIKESMSTVGPEMSNKYKKLIKPLFERLSKQYDYIVVDVRGGFGVYSIIPAVFSDSFIVVTEPDSSSLHQVAKLLTHIDAMAVLESERTRIRGVLVNKALIDGEKEFRLALDASFGISLDQSWAIPFDVKAMRCYKVQLVPFREAPESDFSSATYQAFRGIFDPVTVEWPREQKDLWRNIGQVLWRKRLASQLMALVRVSVLFVAISFCVILLSNSVQRYLGLPREPGIYLESSLPAGSPLEPAFVDVVPLKTRYKKELYNRPLFIEQLRELCLIRGIKQGSLLGWGDVGVCE